jgi:epoxyqueuosine reductase
VCPWNGRFAWELPNDSPYAPREVLADKDAGQLARDLLGMTPAEISAGFKGSPMKRAKLRGLKGNAVVVLGGIGGIGGAEDADVLARALEDLEPPVREHAALALGRIATPAAAAR